MTLTPTSPRMAPCSPPLKHAARRLWRWPAAMLDRGCARHRGASGRDEETASVSRTQKHTQHQAQNDRGQFLLSSGSQIRMSLDTSSRSKSLSQNKRLGRIDSAMRQQRNERFRISRCESGVLASSLAG
jgi:hypothetical protein